MKCSSKADLNEMFGAAMFSGNVTIGRQPIVRMVITDELFNYIERVQNELSKETSRIENTDK